MLTTVQQNLHARSAILMFERSVYYQPNNARMQYSLGLEKGVKGYAKEAEESFRRALLLEPNQSIARVGLGKALCDQGKYWLGIQEYEKVHNPGRLTELLEENKRLVYGTLIESYKKKLLKEPNNAQIYFSLGVMYSRTHRATEAVKQYQKVLEIDPTHENAKFNLLSTKNALGDVF